MPIKDVFLTLFFVSVGLLIDIQVAIDNWLTILVVSLVLLVAKAIIVTGIALFLGQANRPSLLGGLSLCSAGEFSLLLLQKSGDAQLWSPALQQSLIASGALSMALVPSLMQLATPIARWLDARRWGRLKPASPGGRRKKSKQKRQRKVEALLHQRMRRFTSHAIICGYGPVGRALNRALLDEGVPTIIIELNADTVQALMKEGQQVLFADAAHERDLGTGKGRGSRPGGVHFSRSQHGRRITSTCSRAKPRGLCGGPIPFRLRPGATGETRRQPRPSR